MSWEVECIVLWSPAFLHRIAPSIPFFAFVVRLVQRARSTTCTVKLQIDLQYVTVMRGSTTDKTNIWTIDSTEYIFIAGAMFIVNLKGRRVYEKAHQQSPSCPDVPRAGFPRAGKRSSCREVFVIYKFTLMMRNNLTFKGLEVQWCTKFY